MTGKDHKICSKLKALHQRPIDDVGDMTLGDVEAAGIPDYNTVDFSWSLTNKCQYRCTYCYAMDFLNTKLSDTYLDSWKSVITRLSLKTIPSFNIELVGGEPTLHPDIIDIIKSLVNIKNCRRVELVTNLARKEEYYSSLDLPEFEKLQINASYHPQYHNDKFFAKCKRFANLKHVVFYVNMIIMFERDMWKKSAQAIGFFIDNNINYDLHLLQSTAIYEGFNLDKKQIKGDNKTSGDIIEEFKSYVCNELQISEDGMVLPEMTNRSAYTTSSGTKILKELDIRQSGLDRFYNRFTCTPLMWDISHDGHIVNACTDEPLEILGRNVDKSVVCPVETGCSCDVMLVYPKQKS